VRDARSPGYAGTDEELLEIRERVDVDEGGIEPGELTQEILVALSHEQHHAVAGMNDA
jgi:hypothetical protein